MKKAQGISINTIVITAIALLVLVVVATILMSQSGRFSGTIQRCEELGGKCQPGDLDKPAEACAQRVDGFNRPSLTAYCVEGTGNNAQRSEDKVCCVPGQAMEQ
ncbi:MAG: hypothetical protein ACOCWQ_06105 [Nanoarchaeota archaeon]